jgi:hypothetical protein
MSKENDITKTTAPFNFLTFHFHPIMNVFLNNFLFQSFHVRNFPFIHQNSLGLIWPFQVQKSCTKRQKFSAAQRYLVFILFCFFIRPPSPLLPSPLNKKREKKLVLQWRVKLKVALSKNPQLKPCLHLHPLLLLAELLIITFHIYLKCELFTTVLILVIQM